MSSGNFFSEVGVGQVLITDRHLVGVEKWLSLLNTSQLYLQTLAPTLQVNKCGIVESVMAWAKFKAQSQLNTKCTSKKVNKIRGKIHGQQRITTTPFMSNTGLLVGPLCSFGTC